MGKREQLIDIMQDAAKGETRAVLRDRVAALEATNAELTAQVVKLTRFREMCRENYDAFTAMRNDINELIGNMRSQESTLLDGPEMAHEYAAVVEAIRGYVSRAEASAAVKVTKRWPERGDKVWFLNANGYDIELERAAQVFSPDKEYTVRDISIGNWSSSIYFDEVEGGWNSVMFALTTQSAAPKEAEAVARAPVLWAYSYLVERDEACGFTSDEDERMQSARDLVAALSPAQAVTETDEREALIEKYTLALIDLRIRNIPPYVYRQTVREFADELAALSNGEPS